LKKYERALLILGSVGLLFLGGSLLYYSQSLHIHFNESRYDRLMSSKEEMTQTETGQRIARILRLAKESNEWSNKMNTEMGSALYWLGWVLVGIAIFQLSILTPSLRSKVEGMKGADNKYL
jgi:hypothetical protein